MEKKIGYTFQNKNLLKLALTHSSYANEMKNRHLKSNERLEFLGDSVLSLIASRYLYERDQEMPEGDLTRIRASLVCEKSLHGFAAELKLGDMLWLGKGEETSGGRERASILADAFEALLAAIFLDGGLEKAKQFVIPFIEMRLTQDQGELPKDYKSLLQEVIQKNPEEKVSYELVDESGPDHQKTFEVIVCLNSNIIGRGKAFSKKEAEQRAAKEALELMGE